MLDWDVVALLAVQYQSSTFHWSVAPPTGWVLPHYRGCNEQAEGSLELSSIILPNRTDGPHGPTPSSRYGILGNVVLFINLHHLSLAGSLFPIRSRDDRWEQRKNVRGSMRRKSEVAICEKESLSGQNRWNTWLILCLSTSVCSPLHIFSTHMSYCSGHAILEAVIRV